MVALIRFLYAPIDGTHHYYYTSSGDYALRLTVAISRGVEAGKDDTQAGKVRHLLNEIARDGEEAKQHKMQAVLRERTAVLSGIYGELQEHGECPVCGIFGAGEEADGGETISSLRRWGYGGEYPVAGYMGDGWR